MFKKLTSVKALKTLIKISAVVLTSPATVQVASSLYISQPIARITTSIAALILVEGCLLLGWEMLDREGQKATMTQRWLYAGLMWVAYISLFGIALQHHEGIAGLTFRFTLGVMLSYTSLEAGLLASIKVNGQVDKNIMKDQRVKRYARKLARKSAMADLVLEYQMCQLNREMKEKLYTLQVERDTRQQVQRVKSKGRKAVEIVKLDTSLDKANQQRKLSKQQAIDKTLSILMRDPHINPVEIAGEIGRSRQTVYDYFKELELAGKIHRNGSGIVVI